MEKCRSCGDTLVLNGCEENDFSDQCDWCREYEDAEDSEEICSSCNGSGEGMHPGSKCADCKASGVIKY